MGQSASLDVIAAPASLRSLLPDDPDFHPSAGYRVSLKLSVFATYSSPYYNAPQSQARDANSLNAGRSGTEGTRRDFR